MDPVEQAEFCLPDLLDMSKPALRAMQSQFTPYTVGELSNLIRFPSTASNPKAIDDTANRVVALMRDIAPAIAKVTKLKVNLPKGGESQPYVFGHWVQDKKLPTVLVYAHGDVQPADPTKWKSPPFEPTVRGGRLYGRGATDNKSGIMNFLSALKALAAAGKLPVNVKFVVEAEEEVGSLGFATFCNEHPDKVKADAIMIADAGSMFKGVPGLIASTRGSLVLDIKLEAIKTVVHSGIHGGPTPNAYWGMFQLLSKLTNDQQQIIVPGIMDGVPPITEADERRLAALGITARDVARVAGLLPGVLRAGDPNVHPLFSLGRDAAIHAMNVVPSEPGIYSLPASASATVGIRLAPGMDPKRTFQLLEKYLQENRPLNMRLTVESTYQGDGWMQNTESAPFQDASAILQHVYGSPGVQIVNSGGGMPLITQLTRINGAQTPVIFYGADEPGNNIHGHNESVSLKILRDNVKATIYFLNSFGGGSLSRP